MTKIEIGISQQDLIDVIGNVTSPFVVLSELVKNAVDANSEAITINIDTKEKTMQVIDNGHGFTLSDIRNIGEVAKSNKKRAGKMYTNDGLMMLGSKGLAIYSVFYLGGRVLIRTRNHLNESFEIEWDKQEMTPTYEEVSNSNLSFGTEIIVSDIDDDIILLLSSEKELEKFKHLSISNYKEELLIPKLTLIIDKKKYGIEVSNIKEIERDFDSIVKFNYNSTKESIDFQYSSKDPRVSNKKMSIKTKELSSLDEILEKNYYFKPEGLGIDDYIVKKFVNIDDIKVPDFEGAFFVKANKKTKKMKEFGYGVRLFINGFALYRYLDENYDWLNLADISGNKKFNNFKKHNVYGYINFYDFNDNVENIKISNERGGLIENTSYHKFIGIIYSFILYSAINIDIATRSNKFIDTSPKKKKIPEKDDLNNEDFDNKSSSNDEPKEIEKETVQDGENSEDQIEILTKNEKTNILKTLHLEIKEGEHIYLKDPAIINTEELNSNDLSIIPRNDKIIMDNNYTFTGNNSVGWHEIYYFYNNRKETLNIKVNKAKVKWPSTSGKRFFEGSTHFTGDIDLTAINPIVNQLKGLDYDNKYLLYVVSFRVIIEDITKSYLYKRGISLTGQLGNDIKSMILDMQKVLNAKKGDPLGESKRKIHHKFKGYSALNNYLVSVKVKFQNEDYDKLLHSLTHNPSKIEKSLALEIANDIILPLYLLEKLLTDYKITKVKS